MATAHQERRPRHPRQVVRLISNVTQDELSVATGLDRAIVSRWERGLLELPLSRVEDIARVLQVPVDQLVAEPEPQAVAG